MAEEFHPRHILPISSLLSLHSFAPSTAWHQSRLLTRFTLSLHHVDHFHCSQVRESYVVARERTLAQQTTMCKVINQSYCNVVPFPPLRFRKRRSLALWYSGRPASLTSPPHSHLLLPLLRFRPNSLHSFCRLRPLVGLRPSSLASLRSARPSAKSWRPCARRTVPRRSRSTRCRAPRRSG